MNVVCMLIGHSFRKGKSWHDCRICSRCEKHEKHEEHEWTEYTIAPWISVGTRYYRKCKRCGLEEYLEDGEKPKQQAVYHSVETS